jgi:serine/threonine protein kinase
MTRMIANRYQILKKLGTGGLGEVYRVRDLKDDEVRGLKILSRSKTTSQTAQRFKREFRLLAGLQHPNLCRVYDFGMLRDGRSYFTMDYIKGENIFAVGKGLSRDQVYPLIVQLCRALEYIHAKGLIHYDIKPGNVLVEVAGGIKQAVVKLMDFGLAGEEQIRGGAVVKGTFPYIAPEVIKGLAVDHRADLYSLGILLYELFTGRSLRLEGRESFATLIRQRIDWVSELPHRIEEEVSGELRDLILTLLAF